ncbi:MAG TPA: 6,7-dimethyl-8-ribityllumazine synthase [Bryobacteraceae bacterium]|jgi:6,7-dimethyl-8-ribityllumazine synthase|nr:6,7-dimethyl-8-ribityllumazine synthase [Bryobacteraceae bacterium]
MSEYANQSFDTGLSAAGFRFGIVVSRFNSFVTEPLLKGALHAFEQCGAEKGSVEVLRVPGAWELPIAARALASYRKPDAIVCLGAVIRGGTPHFDYVAGEAARGIADASAATGVPIAFGVLTADNAEQATDRAGGKHGNKGFDAAMTAIEMANLLRELGAKP